MVIITRVVRYGIFVNDKDLSKMLSIWIIHSLVWKPYYNDIPAHYIHSSSPIVAPTIGFFFGTNSKRIEYAKYKRSYWLLLGELITAQMGEWAIICSGHSIWGWGRWWVQREVRLNNPQSTFILGYGQ